MKEQADKNNELSLVPTHEVALANISSLIGIVDKVLKDPLPATQIDPLEWWNQLDDNWKRVIAKNLMSKDLFEYEKKLEEFTDSPEISILNSVFTIKELNCNASGLDSLEPIQNLLQLEELNCEGNNISSLEPIRKLVNLNTLYCGGNNISSLEPVSKLVKLVVLYCSVNKISHLEPISELTLLEYFYCDDNRIKSLKPLHGLPNLRFLIWEGNKISKAEMVAFRKRNPNCHNY